MSSSSSRKRNYNSVGAHPRNHRVGYAAAVPSFRSGGAGSGRHGQLQQQQPPQQQRTPPRQSQPREPRDQEVALTHDAIRRMLQGDPIDEPIIVKLLEPRRIPPLPPSPSQYNDNDDDDDDYEEANKRRSVHESVSAFKATVCDDSHIQEVVLLNHCERHVLPEYPYVAFKHNFIVSIQGYVTSSCNSSSTGYLAITDFRILQRQPVPQHQREASVGPRSIVNLGMERPLQGGNFATFLVDRVPFVSNEDLAGRSSSSCSSSLEESMRCISQCLARHAAMKTLQSSTHATVASSTAAASAATAANTEFYQQALKEFATSQLDRQKASLTSNAGREDAHRSQLVVEKYSQALTNALSSIPGSSTLTASKLLEWHAVICGDGLHPRAGQFRTNNVRVGCTSFGPAERVPAQVDNLMKGLQMLHTRLFFSGNAADTIHSGEKDIYQLGWMAITFTAAVVFGILDVHPFADGNGRLSRVAMNWALSYSGLPFVVNLFATPAQRSEYVTALLETRRNTTLVARGNVSDDAFHDAFCHAGLLAPLMEVIADRVARAAMEFHKLYEEKTKLASEQAEARAARVFRERAANGCCLICLDEKPNIATLCCGKAVHLNCMAEWLSSRNSCPQCRAEMPALVSTRVAAGVSVGDPNAAANEIDDTTSTANENDINNTEFDTTDDDSDDTFEEVAPSNNNYNPHNNNNDTTSEEDTEEDTNDTTAEMAGNIQHRAGPIFCARGACRNKAAVDCSVGYCGRCCVLFGYQACERHNR